MRVRFCGSTELDPCLCFVSVLKLINYAKTKRPAHPLRPCVETQCKISQTLPTALKNAKEKNQSHAAGRWHCSGFAVVPWYPFGWKAAILQKKCSKGNMQMTQPGLVSSKGFLQLFLVTGNKWTMPCDRLVDPLARKEDACCTILIHCRYQCPMTCSAAQLLSWVQWPHLPPTKGRVLLWCHPNVPHVEQGASKQQKWGLTWPDTVQI